MTNLYYARQSAFEAFILLGRGGGGVHATLFWGPGNPQSRLDRDLLDDFEPVSVEAHDLEVRV